MNALAHFPVTPRRAITIERMASSAGGWVATFPAETHGPDFFRHHPTLWGLLSRIKSPALRQGLPITCPARISVEPRGPSATWGWTVRLMIGEVVDREAHFDSYRLAYAWANETAQEFGVPLDDNSSSGDAA